MLITVGHPPIDMGMCVFVQPPAVELGPKKKNGLEAEDDDAHVCAQRKAKWGKADTAAQTKTSCRAQLLGASTFKQNVPYIENNNHMHIIGCTYGQPMMAAEVSYQKEGKK